MADEKYPADDGIIELIDLIESGDTVKSGAAAKAYANASTMQTEADDLDFESILQATEKKTGGSDQQASAVVDAHEQLDMSGMDDMENLFDALDIPKASPSGSSAPNVEAPASTPKETPENDGMDDLDSVLDELLGDPPAQPKADSKKQPVLSQEDFNDDISGEEESALAFDVNNILDTLDEEQDKSQLSGPVAEEKPDFPELDAPGNGIEENLREEILESPSANSISDDLDALLDFEETGASKEEEPDLPPFGESSNVSATLEEDDDSALLEDSGTQPLNGSDVLTESNELPTDKLSASYSVAANGQNEIVKGSKPVAEGTSRSFPPELLTQLLQSIVPAQSFNAQEKIEDFARQLGSQSAHLESLIKRVDELEGYARELEKELSVAREKIALLEKGIESSARFEDLFTEGSALQKGFLELMSNSVANAVSTVKADQQEITLLTEKFSSLDARGRSEAQRLDMLEKHIANMEEDFESKVEKAAAQSVTRILHEEIARLMSENE